MSKGQRALLPPEDEKRLQQLAATGSDASRQRARVILAWHDGVSVPETASRTGLTENQIRYMLRLYKQKGLDLFMVDTAPVKAASGAEESPAEVEPTVPGSITIEALCAEYDVDMKHAEHVAGLARRLFTDTMNIHRLPHSSRSLLEAAALVHNIAYEIDQPNHHTRGRDILLERPIRGMTDDERRILALTTAFHRKKVRTDREPAFGALSAELQQDTLALSALLRVADGLDNSQTQTTNIVQIQASPQEVTVYVDGKCAIDDAAQAQKKADLWHQIFPARIRVVPETANLEMAPVSPVTSAAAPLPDLSPRLDSSMTINRAGRVFTLNTLDRIDALLRQGQGGDLSVLPALGREASRLNSAILLADAKDFSAEVSWLFETFEEARLNAAMAENAVAYADEVNDGDNGEVVETLKAKGRSWEAKARSALTTFDMRRYERLAADLRSALSAEVDPDDKALVAFHVGPMLWDQLSSLRDVLEHGTSVKDALEAARRLQDHLLAFRELLGREAGQVLEMLGGFENYLNALQTTYSLYASLEPPAPVKKGRKLIQPPPDPAQEALRATQSEALDSLADGLPSAWASVNNSVFRRAFALAVAAP